jgi:hypothetical protein
LQDTATVFSGELVSEENTSEPRRRPNLQQKIDIHKYMPTFCTVFYIFLFLLYLLTGEGVGAITAEDEDLAVTEDLTNGRVGLVRRVGSVDAFVRIANLK